MPMIPLNQLAFPSDWLALCIVKKDVACRHVRPKKRRRHSAWACTLKRRSPTTKIALLIAARL
jgi:hypothetical protein